MINHIINEDIIINGHHCQVFIEYPNRYGNDPAIIPIMIGFINCFI